MDQKNNFIIRKEYFGGLIYNKEKGRTDGFLKPEEYIFLKNYQHQSLMCDVVKNFVKKNARWKKNGLITNGKLNADFIEAPIIKDNVLSAPIITYLHITFGCNLSCKHCMFAGKKQRPDELSIDEIINLVLIPLIQLGSYGLRITGGEPTIRKDLFKVIHFAKSQGMMVEINTNGFFDEDIRKKIVESGLDRIIISLDGDEKLHDRIRGHGTFKKVIKTIEYISDYNSNCEEKKKIPIRINTTISRDNVHLLRYFAGLSELYHMEINFNPLRPYGKGRGLTDKMLSPEGFKKFSEQLNSIKEEWGDRIKMRNLNFDLFSRYKSAHLNPFPFDKSTCAAANYGLGILPNGEGNICGYLAGIKKFKTPNLRSSKILDIWHSEAFHKVRECKKELCENCKFYRKECIGFCHVMSYAETGEFGKTDRYCFAHLI